MITIYTDGSCIKNGAEGGFGVVVFDENEQILSAISEREVNTTNNKMELKAIISACTYADNNYPNEPVIIYSDSQYCVRSVNEWMNTWAKNGWYNSKKEEVKNIDLMKILYNNFNKDFYHCQLQWVKGHEGHVGNEMADALATNNIEKFYKLLDKNNNTIANRIII